MTVPPRPHPLRAVLLLLLLAAGTGTVWADDPPAPAEAGRRNAIKGLRATLRKVAGSPWVQRKGEELRKTLEALSALGGVEAGRAALEALPSRDAAVRDALFDLVEREHHASLVKPLAAILEHKVYRRDADARRRVAHALAVMDDVEAIEPLATLIRFDEDAEVVAEAAQALSGYAAAPIKQRRIAVRRLVDLYETTYNLKESVRPEDKILRKQAHDRYEVYGKPLRHALQALTGVQLTRPQEWRRWWNTNKKRDRWGRETDPTVPRRR